MFGGVDDTLDRDAGSSASRLCSSAESTSTGEVVQQRLLRLARIALVKLDVRAADLDPRHAVLRRGRREAVIGYASAVTSGSAV